LLAGVTIGPPITIPGYAISKGYDDTTTREIAIRAEVGMGTVFTYADNKRDLLFATGRNGISAAGKRLFELPLRCGDSFLYVAHSYQRFSLLGRAHS
jgi:AcrR family transcriptional regulator